MKRKEPRPTYSNNGEAATAVARPAPPQSDSTLYSLIKRGMKIPIGYITGLDLSSSVTPHASSHQNGGSDEINVGGLSGTLADPQTPADHETSHRDGGGDELSILQLGGYPGGGTTFLRDDGSFQSVTVGNASYAAGTFTISTGTFKIMAKRLVLSSTERATLEETGRLVIL